MKLEHLIIHCTDTPRNRDVSKENIIAWHTSPKEYGGNGWDRVGYSDMIDLQGRLINLRPFNQDDEVDYNEMTWGVKGINGISRHIVYVGGQGSTGKPENTMNDNQKKTLEIYIKYTLLRHPNITIHGHNEFSNKACPCFDVQEYLKSISIFQLRGTQ